MPAPRPSKLVAGMRRLPQIRDPSVSATLARPEIRIVPKPELAAELGVTASALATTARISTIGDTASNQPKFDTGNRRIPIVVRLNAAARHDLLTVRNQRVPSTSGAQVPIGVVADVKLASGPSSIKRYDRQFQVPVAADLAAGVPLGPALAAVQSLPTGAGHACRHLGPEVGRRRGHRRDLLELRLAMGSGILLVYVVLVLLFSSFLHAVLDPAVAAAGDRRRDLRALPRRLCHRPVGGDRLPDADGDRHQERDHAGGIRA